MKNLPVLYSQRDPKWAAQRLGTVNGSTIGDFGCYVTAFAMLACYYGHTLTPADLDNILTDKGYYVSGNLMQDKNLQSVFADCIYQGSISYANVPADLNKLKDLLADANTMVVLEVDFNPSLVGVQTHFVVAVSCDGSTVKIADTWTGTIKTLDSSNYGDAKTTIQKYVVYKGTPASGLIYKSYDLANMDSNKVAIDVLVRVLNGEFVEKTKYDTDIKALNTSLNDANVALAKANTTIDGLKIDLSVCQNKPPVIKEVEVVKTIDNPQQAETIKKLTNDLKTANDTIATQTKALAKYASSSTASKSALQKIINKLSTFIK